MPTSGFSLRVELREAMLSDAWDARRDRSLPDELRIESTKIDDGRCLVSVAGEVDRQTSPRFAAGLDLAARSEATAVIVDLTECSLIDSSGLSVLVDLDMRLRNSGRGLALIASGTRPLGVFERTGVDSVFRIVPSLAAALIPTEERWLDETQRRLAIRDANEQLEQSCVGLGSSGADEFVFICECGDRACTSLLHLALAEYESVRAHPARFAIARNHENPEDERVVHENGRFAIVETVTGEHSKPALESNPRWQRGEPW